MHICECISVLPQLISILPCFQHTADLVLAFQPRITQQICKNTLLISRQKWQSPPMTSAPRIAFFFSFSFSFFISCSAPETQILTHCSRPSPPPHMWTRWHVSRKIQSYTQTWTQYDTFTVLPICRKDATMHEDTHTNKYILSYCSGDAVWHRTTLRLRRAGHLDCKEKTSLFFLLLSPPSLSALYLSLFSGLNSLLHPGTLRALCDSGDKEGDTKKQRTKEAKLTQCNRNFRHI